MRLFAFYLPQFHRIPENDEWWGEGFTEWTNLKKAKPLFPGHRQPLIPLHKNYYNLLDKQTVAWQTDLMHKYGVDGFIYYHYYFNGKLLLEKPVANLLKWKEIDQPFFFCWANHDWVRSWNGTRELLQEQTYGEEEDWERHFQYLLPYFLDERYEKKDNCPVFMLYDSAFEQKEKLFSYLDRRCKESGFGGLYLIETYNGGPDWKKTFAAFQDQKSSVTKKVFLREFSCCRTGIRHNPKYSPGRLERRLRKAACQLMKKTYVTIFHGEEFYRYILEEEPYGEDLIHCLFFEWDNTPRHGARGCIVTPPKRETFFRLMKKLEQDEYVFVNAWNEWAEGMVLEPSEQNHYKYLEWIRDWRAHV